MSRLLVVMARTAVTPTEVLSDPVVVVRGGKIIEVARRGAFELPADAELLDLGDLTLVPGFVDIHIHGALGSRADESPEAVLKMSEFVSKHGTTAFLPTVNSLKGVNNVVAAQQILAGSLPRGAGIVGIHMEGPFLAPKNLPGAGQVDAHLLPPDLGYLRECWEASAGLLKIMGVGIELDGAIPLIKALRDYGIVPAVAHTKATYEAFRAAVLAGVRHATHLYNVMTGMHHRAPGVVGGVLSSDQVTAELIGDGFHVHPAAMEVALRCKGPERLALITDMTQFAGLPDGEYGHVTVKDGIARLKGFDASRDNTIAGSVWPIEVGLKNVLALGHRLKDAVRMTTLTPATIAGLSAYKGSIEPGKDADLVALNDAVDVVMTMVRGTVVFLKNGEGRRTDEVGLNC